MEKLEDFSRVIKLVSGGNINTLRTFDTSVIFFSSPVQNEYVSLVTGFNETKVKVFFSVAC